MRCLKSLNILDTPDTASAQNEPIEDDDLLKKLDTEGVQPENDQELGNLYTYQHESSLPSDVPQGERSQITKYPNKMSNYTQHKLIKREMFRAF